MSRLTGKTILITGGSSGMGLETARLALREGACVGITGRNPSKLDAAVEALKGEAGDAADRLLAQRGDAGSLESIDETVDAVAQRFGGLDGLFGNAGIGRFGPIAQESEADFDALVNVNFKGLFFTVQRALPRMADGGSIVLNASWTAHRGLPVGHAYAATKAAVLSLGRTLAAELAARRIRVNTVSPGYIETPIVDSIGLSDADRRARAAEVPLHRWGSPEEVAHAVAFLLSDEATYISGQDLIIDGGLVGVHRAG